MYKINFFQKRNKNIPYLKSKLKNSFLQKLFLIGFLTLSIFSMKSQTAPNISYATPQNYLLNAAITTLAPVNSGGSVPALTYKQVSTFAGTTAGFLDGTGTAAKMAGPLGMTMDASGNIYFVDAANFRIRKMTPAGVVTTIAGDGYSFLFYGRERNNAVGSEASFSWPSGIVLDTANNCLYVADKENDVIRKVSLTGTFAVTTFAGSGTSSSLDGTGTAATFKKPNGIAIDPTNTYLYVTDRTGNKIRRITISTAQVVTIAGSGTASTVDNATGTSATFNDPTGIAVDANAIYVSDFGGNKIRKIALTAPYAVTTFAGSGVASSVDGTGVAATFDTPFGITLDGAGNLFITEWGDKIRKITPAGIVTTIAGSGAASSVDGNGIAATFNNPSGIVINPTTGIGYVSDYASDRIRKIELGGYAVSPILPAGLSLNSSTGGITGTPTAINNGPLNYSISAYNYYGNSTATVAITTANVPTLTTTAASALTQTTATTGGNVTANGGSTLLEKGICWSTSANPTILNTKVLEGTTTTGSYTAAITGLVASTTYYIRAYATNSVGTAYGTQVSFTTLITPPTISYTASNTFTVNAPITTLAVSNTGGTVNGLASTNVSTFAGNTLGFVNASGTAAQFNYPYDVASDVSGTIYVSDYNNFAIRKITPAGLVSTLAGGNGQGMTDGTGSSVKFYTPNGITTDRLGNVFVADGVTGIRKINASGTVTTLLSYLNSSIPFGITKGIVVNTSGIIYFSDNKHLIYKIDTSNNLTVFAGGDNISGTDDGIGTAARFNNPNGLALDATGNVYVADTDNQKIRKITPSGVVTTLAGSTQGFNDGTGLSAKFNNPFGITVDASGTLYIAERSNNRIRKITPSAVVTTIAGIAIAGSMDGNATLASFSNPRGITSDSDGNLYVADYGNHKIRKIATSNGFSISPALPAGLVLNANGSISGTPTIATAATTYTVTATNAGGLSSFEVSIATLALPVITTTAARSITATALTTGGMVTSAAASVTAAGMCYGTSPLPTLLDTFTTDVLNEGSFTRTIGNLTALTTYYIRAYATNSVGTSYGNQIVVNTPMYAPIISYYSPIPFIVNTPITALEVSNSGGAIPTQLYGVSTVAGGNVPGSADGALGTALFSNPTAVVKDSQGNLFVVDYFNHGIRKIAPNGIVSFYAGGSGPGSADGPRANSSFKNPFGLAIDHLDNLYVSEPLAHTIRKITASGIVSTFAGTYGVPNSDNLSFNSPRGLTCDAAGNVYVIDAGNSRIQKITPNGIMSIIFVGGDVGVSYNMVFDSVGNLWLATESTQGGLKKINTNGVVTSTLFGRTTKSIAIDQSDNIYIADQLGAVRKITPSIAISEITSGGIGFADGEFAVAKFNGISGLYLDQEGLLYVADTDNNRVRVITPFGYSVTPALPAGLVLNTDGSITGTPTVATAATNYTITGINSGGNSSTALNFAIATFPTLTTTAASAVIATSATAGGNVTSDGYTSVTERGVCWSTTSNPTIADAKTTNGTETGTFTSSITGLSPVTTYYIRAYATNSVGTVYGNEIVVNTPMYAPVISYSSPNAFVVDNPITALEVSNSGGATTSTIDGDTPAVVSTFAGSCGTSGATNGQGTAASFNSPNAVAVDGNNNVYVSDLSNRKIRKITATGIVSDFASVTGPQGIAVDANGNVYVNTANEIRKYIQNGTFTILAASTNFTSSKGLAVDTNGNVYVADFGASKIMKISPSGVISTLAGSGDWGGADGLAANATFFTPVAVAVDASGSVYVADYDAARIRKITTNGIVSTLAGSTWGFQNGTGSEARFDSLAGIAVDAFGNVYVTDYYNYAIRKITPQGVVTTLTGFSAGSCTDGSLNQAKFASPTGLTIDASGNLYVSDSSSNTIRKITLNPYSVAPALPAGLALNPDGSITGTPTLATAATDYVVTATNSGGSSSYTLNFAITTIPSLTTTEASVITAITATLGGNVTSDGYASVTARGVCWSTSPNPTTAGAKTTNGTGTGIFESAITGLSPVTAYYVRAYATNSVGTKYGNQISFTTVALVLPTLSTTVITAITSTTALSGGTITNDGGTSVTARGVCWSTTSNPTISDSKTTDGTGTGIFTSAITGLSPLSTYYVRAYATNSAGTAYGNEISFVTFALPVVVTRGPTTTGFPVITYTSAQCGGSIQSLGGSTQITKGIYYSESPTPTAINTISTIQTSGSTPLLYDTLLSNLKPNTTYYVRAYVSNEAGTGLGEIVSFTTRPLLFTVSGMNESDFGEGYTKIVVGGNINNISLYSNLYFEPTAYGVCWSTNANSNPTITDASTIIGATTDEFLESGQSFLSFERQLTGLTPNTTYYARSFAKNATEVTYGTLYSFDSFIGKPILTSTSANITSCSADLGGLISDASGGVMGIKGVVYSTNQQTVINATSPNSGIGGVSSITSTGIGAFSLNKSNLLPNTTYYYKAYAFGSAPSIENIKLGWGDVKSFTTLAAAIPTITLSTVSVSNNGTITASSLGSSSSCGGAISEGGFCYSTSINPTVLNDKISLYATEYSLNNFLTGANLFLEITNYNPSQTYYVRSYAINTAGIAYSNNWILAIVAPSNLTVSQSIVSGTVGVTMSSITVSNSGGVATSYSISPSLPNGLLFDTLLGTISGTPLALLDPTTFTITATNSAGSTSTTVSLTINNSIPTNLTSSQSSLSVLLGTMIVPITMSNSGGIVTSYTISPMLPAGLTLNGTTGTISGTPTALLSLTNYTITATNSIGSTTTIIGILVKSEKVWTGTISTAWEIAENWSPTGVPNSGDPIKIPSNLTNYPILDQNRNIGSLFLEGLATLSLVTNTLSIEGAVIGTGSFIGDANAGLELIGSENATINLSINKNINTLTINRTGNVTIESPITISNLLTVTQGTLNTGDVITLKSTATKTAIVNIVTGNIIGKVTVERYIPAKRAFRFLSPSVTTATSIKANWQEGANNSSALYANNMNPKPGFGTHITGSTSGSNGFDATQTTNASLFGFNNSTGQWTTISNTDTNLLNAGTAYRLMVRGDRSIDMTSNDPAATATILRATGTLFIGTKRLYGDALNQMTNGYSLIGNPYQTPVDMKAVLDAAIGLVTQYCYVWEPRQNTRGAYVSVGVQTGVNSINGSFATKYLQPGQAAFVRKDASANLASLTFSEDFKHLSTNENVFRQETSNLSLLKVGMYSNGTSLDGLAIIFDTNSNNEIDANDAGKLANLDEDIATSNNGSLSSIESRQFPVNNEEIQLYATKFRATNYTLKTTLENYSGPTPYLLDTYTQNYTLLNGNSETIYPFSVDSTVPNSVATNRFKIVFSNAVLNTTDFEKGCYLYPNPSTDSAFYVHLNGLNSSTKVTLFNTLGQQIQLNVNTTENNSYFCKTTSKLPTGAYIVIIEQDGKKATKKWMVQ